MRVAALLAVLALTPGTAGAVQVLTNPSFETGTLAGWTTSGLGTTGSCPSAGRDWNVATSGAATGCSTVGTPTDGLYAAYVMNDGPGAMTYFLRQSVAVPVGVTSAVLSWSDSIVASYGGAARFFRAAFIDAGTVSNVVFNLSVPFSDFDPAWTARSVDVTSLLQGYGGQTVSLSFENVIPAPWTGAAGLGLDKVALDIVAAPVSAPEPASMVLLGAGLVGLGLRRRSGRE